MLSLLISNITDPRYNLATEEYLTYTKKIKNPIFFLWQNNNTIVVGRNQNTFAEINLEQAQKDEVNIVRRNTGGGTVYQDLGNICFSSIFFKDDKSSSQDNFKKSLEPIIQFLKSKNINAQFSGRNDIEVDGKKISGNAQLKTSERILEHGTLLYDVDLSKLKNYLNVDRTKMETKKISSVVSRVTNIVDLLNEKSDVNSFKNDLKEFYKNSEEVEEITLNNNDLEKIEELVVKKYSNWEWTFGKNGTFNKMNKIYIPGFGLIEIDIQTEDGIIKDIKFYGDFMGYHGTEKLEADLIGKNYSIPVIREILESSNLIEVFGDNVDINQIQELIFT
ncbi:lipoate--protein ligase [Mesoplasma photuris]|uniref:lipoate--protein ligase n=1 Tax=Mesoplasma photuris TaxID=217731 RepID=UPI0004E1F12A|nr:lipoate--protein ligase [Mesoplasma photuris]